MSPTAVFFVIFGKIWWVPHTSDESRTHLDEMQVSLSYMLVPFSIKWKDNFIIIVIWRKNLPWLNSFTRYPFPREVVWSICVYQLWDIFFWLFTHHKMLNYQYRIRITCYTPPPLFFSISLFTEMDSVQYELKLKACFLLGYPRLGHIVSPDSIGTEQHFHEYRFICFFPLLFPLLFYFNGTLSCTLKLIPNYK